MTDGAQAVQGWRGFRFAAAVLLILGVTAVIYSPLRDAGFIWDDDSYVTENRALFGKVGLKKIWFEPGATPQYYPATFSSFWVERRLFGFNPKVFHLNNVLLHGLNAVLLFIVLRRLKIPGALLAGLIFAVHPVHVESVAWIAERKNVLSGLFYLSSLLAWIHFAAWDREDGASRSRLYYAASLVFFAFALLSKTVTCTLPVVIILLEWWRTGTFRSRTLGLLAPMFAAGIVMGSITAGLEKSLVGAVGDDWAFSLAERVLIAGRVFWFYIEKLLWPSALCFNYERWHVEAGNWVLYMFPGAAVALLAGAWFMRKDIGRGPLTALLFFGVSLAPALGFVNVYPMRFSFVADHFQYLASIGLITLAAALLTRAAASLGSAGSFRVRAVSSLVVVVMLGFLAMSRAEVFRSSERLWYDTLRKNPRSWLAHSNVGNIYLGERRIQEAGDHFSAALHLKPDYEVTHYNLGLLLAMQGQYKEAIERYEEAVRIRPNFTDAYCRMGSCYMALKDLDAAIEAFQNAVETAPDQFEVHYQLAAIYHAERRYSEALRHYATAAALNPWFADPLNNMAWIMSTHPDPKLRNGQQALRMAARACDLSGYRNPVFLTTLAAAHAETGDFKKAVDLEKKASGMALRAGNNELVRSGSHRLERYYRGEPYRETGQ